MMLILLASFGLGLANAYTLSLSKTYSGTTFFDGWTYNQSAIDADNFGNVHFVGQTDALALNLTYLNSAGNAIVAVDNTTSGVGDSTFGRNVVRLISKDPISIGTLVLADFLHVPYGCSTWPSFWTIASSTQKSAQGEIDIFESVNQRTHNQMTLHTGTGCTQSNVSSSSAFAYTDATVLSTNCDHTVNDNLGCAFSDSRDGSAGAGFASSGGGVYAMLWDADGIRTWFFPRSSLPSDIQSASQSPNPEGWGEPQASWPAATCNPQTFFEAQSLVLGTNICGAFAGNAAIYSQTCTGTCTDLVGDPTNYNNAYFEVAYIKTFTGAPTSVTATGTATAPGGSSTGGGGGNGSGAGGRATGWISGCIAAVVLLGLPALF
ncbi:glycoside hydrolase family 16 protein [Atractiella rhizophila]|nr:glycoside hydrolase family 16 protein [Atractiella rhizophila]